MKNQPYRGSHLPALIRLFGQTTGPVWEFGSGMYSTPYLHWACWANQRPLVTFEGQAEWMPFALQFGTPYHTVRHVTDWGSLDLSGPCSLALIDHDGPGVLRGHEVVKLQHAEYLVLHDAERPDKYGFTEACKLFRYQHVCRNSRIRTMVLSNLHDLTGFTL